MLHAEQIALRSQKRQDASQRQAAMLLVARLAVGWQQQQMLDVWLAWCERSCLASVHTSLSEQLTVSSSRVGWLQVQNDDLEERNHKLASEQQALGALQESQQMLEKGFPCSTGFRQEIRNDNDSVVSFGGLREFQ